MTCHDSMCAIEGCEPGSTTDCPADFECRSPLEGGTRCEPESAACVGDGSRGMGMACACDRDCNAEAPVCIQASIGAMDLGGCTVRPCSLLDTDPCPDGVSGGAYGCCLVPGVVGAPTCMPMALMDLLGISAFCAT